MSLWHFLAAIDGFGRAQGWKLDDNDKGPAMTAERLKELGIEGFV